MNGVGRNTSVLKQCKKMIIRVSHANYSLVKREKPRQGWLYILRCALPHFSLYPRRRFPSGAKLTQYVLSSPLSSVAAIASAIFFGRLFLWSHKVVESQF